MKWNKPRNPETLQKHYEHREISNMSDKDEIVLSPPNKKLKLSGPNSGPSTVSADENVSQAVLMQNCT